MFILNGHIFQSDLENRNKKIPARGINTMLIFLLGPLLRSPNLGAAPLKSKVPIKIH